jgi:light-harvesting complex II chlorophyll a/b binding protein 5
MAALQVNAFFKKAAPAPAKKAAPAKKGLFPAKKAAPVKKAAPAQTKKIVKKAPVKKIVKKAPVKKSSGKPTQAGGDLAKWYGE